MSRRWLSVVLALVALGLVPVSAAHATADVRRVWGQDRILTAIALAGDAFDAAPAAVIARSDASPDALAAAPLAAAAGGPVLLNPPDHLEAAVRDELERLGVDTVYLVGGEQAQSPEVEAELASMDGVSVERVDDRDHPTRYGTAAAAARRAVALWGGGGAPHVLVALGTGWADALAAGALAGHARYPILLTDRDEVPAVTNETLDELGASTVTVVGGPVAIPQATADQLGGAGTTRERIGGDTRFDTSRLLADAAVAAGANPATAIVATGLNWPDGLAAGPVAYAEGGVLLLVHPSHLADSPHTHDWLADRKATVTEIVVAGGTGAVQDAVLDQLAQATTSLDTLDLAWVQVADGLTRPVWVGEAPGDGRLWVLEKPGRITAVAADGSTEVLADLRAIVEDGGNEQGLLGLAFHPDFAHNGRLFVYYTRAGADNDNWLSEFAYLGGRVVNEQVLARFEHPDGASNHNGGGVVVGPEGDLYVSLGDGGGGGDTYGNGQNTGTPLGAILRYRIGDPGHIAPASGNPFVGRDGDDRIWAYGLRNPWRFTTDGVDDALLIGDVGQGSWEEVDAAPLSAAGRNYGWSCREGTHDYAGGATCDPDADLTDPVYEYATHDGGTCAVTGGVVYRGHDLPELAGTYLFADYCAPTLRSFRYAGGAATEQRIWGGVSAGPAASFGTDLRGEVYVATDSSGTILKLVRG